MKKLIILLIFAVIVSSCATSTQVGDIRVLEVGMSRAQVDAYWGSPRRILSQEYTRDGIIETLEYRAYYNDVYAVQFIDGYVSSYYILYSEFYTRPSSRRDKSNRPEKPRDSRPEKDRHRKSTRDKRPAKRSELNEKQRNRHDTERPTHKRPIDEKEKEQK